MENEIIEYFIKNLNFGKSKPLYESDIKKALNCEKNDIKNALTLAEQKHNLIIKHGRYIDSEKGLSLTSFGKDVKDKDGWIKYIENKDLDNDKFNLNINNDFRDSTIGQVNQSSNFSNSPQTINTTAKSIKDHKKGFIIRFWKLISENKLVSGILLIVIVYLIKVIFGIDLKN